MKSKLVRRRASIKDLEEITKIQCSPGNWNYDPYMQGMANGMLLSLNVATDDPREPVFMEAPEVWLADVPVDPSVMPVTASAPGLPRILYWGGRPGATELIPKNTTYRAGIWLTDSIKVAASFGTEIYLVEATGLNNPFIVDAQGEFYSEIPTPQSMLDEGFTHLDTCDSDLIVKYARECGYDSVIIKDVTEGFSGGGVGLSHQTGTDYVLLKKSQGKIVSSFDYRAILDVWGMPKDPKFATTKRAVKTYTDEELADWLEILDEETYDIPGALVERMVKINGLTFEWKLGRKMLILNDDVYLSYDKADHTFYYIDDIKDWVFGLSNDEMIDYVGEPDDLYNGHIGASLNDFKKNPSKVYHYTTPDGLEGIKEEGELRGGSGTGMTNRYASGVFTSVDPEEYADGTYGTICIDIDLPGFMRVHPDTNLSFEPEVEECLLREPLVSALGLEDVNVEPDNSGGMSYQTIIVGASIPVEFLSVEGQPLGDAEGKMASKTAGERLRLDKIYDKEQLEDPSEALHKFISPEDLDVAFPVKTMQPSEIAKLETFRDTSTIMEMYEAGAGPKQKKIVGDKMKRFDASRVIVIAGTTLLDGYHHAIAAIKLNKPVRYINIYDTPEGHKVTASSPGLPRVIKEVSRQEVMEAENAANSKGKHENNPYRTFYTADSFGYGRDSATFYLLEVPIKLLNHQHDPEAPDFQPLSDATNARIDDYASRETKAPPVLITYAPRKWPTKYGKGLAFVANGNHRVEAARRAGKTTVEAYMPSNDYDFWVGTVLAAEDGPLARLKVAALQQQETPAFKSWFGASKVVREETGKLKLDHYESSNAEVTHRRSREIPMDEFLTLNNPAQPWRAGIRLASAFCKAAKEWTQRELMSYFLKKELGPNSAVTLTKLGAFHEGEDPLGAAIPERLSHRFALHPDDWEATFHSLTLKESSKLKFYKPVIVDIKPGTLVGDMYVANRFYNANSEVDKAKYAQAYRASLKPWPVNLKDYVMPELLIPGGKTAKVEYDMDNGEGTPREVKLTYKGKKGPDFLIYIFPQADKSLDAEVNVITDAGETDKPYTPWVEAKDTQLATAQALATKIRECMDQEYNTRADAARRAGNRLLAQELQREASNIYQEVLNDIITQLVDIPNAKWTGWKVPKGN